MRPCNTPRRARHSGRLLCEFQGLQWKMARMLMQLDAARLMLRRATINAAKGFPSMAEASMAKAFSNEMAITVTNEALQIFGGMGYLRECPLERMVRERTPARLGHRGWHRGNSARIISLPRSSGDASASGRQLLEWHIRGERTRKRERTMIGRRSFLVASTLLIGLAGAQNAVAQTLSVGRSTVECRPTQFVSRSSIPSARSPASSCRSRKAFLA